MEEPRVHRFEDSGEAYDASQCDEDIKDGDVLVVVSEAERSVAILAKAWPVAVTPGLVTDLTTRFHVPMPRTTIEAVLAMHVEAGEPADRYARSLELARSQIAELGTAPVTGQLPMSRWDEHQAMAREEYCGYQGEHAWCYWPPRHAGHEDAATHSDGTPIGRWTEDGYPV